MRRLTMLSVLVTLLMAVACWANGTVTDVTFHSATLGSDQHMNVYLPEGYNPAGHYAVIYFLHGLGYNYMGYDLTPVLDGLIAAHAIEPVIFVRPNGMCGPYAGSMWTNSALYGNWEDYVVNDVVPYVDTHYATMANRGHRVLMGHSMGGFGAITIALKHSELFGNVSSFSGFLSLLPFDYFRNVVLYENGGAAPFTYVPSASHFFTLAAYTASGAFSPNFASPPYYVNFPLDANGQTVAATFEHWLTHMPPYTARHAATLQPLNIYMDCGTNDEMGFYPMNLAFGDTLNALGIPFHFESFTGTHSDHLAQRFQISLLRLNAEHILPVELTSFDAVNDPNGITVQWRTASESHNSGFEIRRDDHVVATLEGAGTSPESHDYAWQDVDVVSGRVYAYTLTAVDDNGDRRVLGEKSVEFHGVRASEATDYALEQNYPNPFNPTTTIQYYLPEDAAVQLVIYALNGQRVATLAEGYQQAGSHGVSWDGRGFASGVYVYQLQVGDKLLSHKMMLLK